MASAVGDDGSGGSSATSGLQELTDIVNSRLALIATIDASVDKIIGDDEALKSAKEVALKHEKGLLQSIIDDVDEMSTFLKNIILIENLFNSAYLPHKKLQEQARKQFAPNIGKYEDKEKVLSEEKSFVTLMFAAQTHLRSFKGWIDKVVKQCEQENVKIKSNSGAVIKNMERAFYKAFYFYTNDKNGFNKMTDVLRCSFVFDDFENLYKCFTVIEKMADAKEGGILRVKDRYNPSSIPFGYRDILINIFCPGSKIVCEMQLHWYPLYWYKKISHKMYKRARLFERSNANKAYDYAQKYLAKKIGSIAKYEPSKEEMDQMDDGVHGDQKENDDEDATAIAKVLKEFGLPAKFIDGYAQKLTEEGWEDPQDWNTLEMDELLQLGFKKGHAIKFERKAKDWKPQAKSKDTAASGATNKSEDDAQDAQDTDDTDDAKQELASDYDCTLTTLNGKGCTGPTSIGDEYNGKCHEKDVTLDSNGFQIWTVPQNGKYRIRCLGASGGDNLCQHIYNCHPKKEIKLSGGKGAEVCGVIDLKKGDVIVILVGQKGVDVPVTNSNYTGAGGGGGTFVTRQGKNGPEALFVAAGGHGACHFRFEVNGIDGLGISAENRRDVEKFGGTESDGKAGRGGSFHYDVYHFKSYERGLTDMNKCNGGCFINENGIGGDRFHDNSGGTQGGFGGGGGSYQQGGGGGGYVGGLVAPSDSNDKLLPTYGALSFNICLDHADSTDSVDVNNVFMKSGVNVGDGGVDIKLLSK